MLALCNTSDLNPLSRSPQDDDLSLTRAGLGFFEVNVVPAPVRVFVAKVSDRMHSIAFRRAELMRAASAICAAQAYHQPSRLMVKV